MIPEVWGLAADVRGVVLGVLRGGVEPAAVRVEGLGGARCREALAALDALPPEGRLAACEELAAEVGATLPAGLALVHPGWVRRVLEGESGDVVRAATSGAPAEARRVADEILAARGASARRVPDGPAVAALQRVTFAGMAPVPTEATGGPPQARALCALSFGALLEEIDRRGATALGLALAGAPDDVLARAAAGAGEPFARLVLAAAKSSATAEARAEARALVAASPARGAVRAVGLSALARALAPEGEAAVAAVAQRLPPAVGDALVACAAKETA